MKAMKDPDNYHMISTDLPTRKRKKRQESLRLDESFARTSLQASASASQDRMEGDVDHDKKSACTKRDIRLVD